MTWAWILGILAALLLLLCCTRVGIQAAMQGDAFTLDAKIGLFRIHLLPGKKKKAEKSVDQTQKREKKEKQSIAKPSLEEIKDAVRTLYPPLKRALGKTRRGILIKPLRISVVFGGANNPAQAAQLYGYSNTIMWTVMPELEALLDIPDPRLHIGLDFETEKTAVEGNVGISLRIGTILSVGLTVGLPALRWFLRYQKKHKQQPPTPEKEPAKA